jgi:lipopolysaccharide export system permease protein
MKKLRQQLFVKILSKAFIITAFLASLLWLIQAFRYFSLIVVYRLKWLSLIKLMLWAVPDIVALLFPLSFFLSVLSVYYESKKDHTFTILSSAGLSPRAILTPVLWASSCGVFILYILTAFLCPFLTQKFHENKAALTTNLVFDMLPKREFFEFGSTVFYVDETLPGKKLGGLFLFSQAQKNQNMTLIAEKALLLSEGQTLKTTLENGTYHVFSKKGKKPYALTFEHYSPEIHLYQTHHHTRGKKPHEMRFFELIRAYQKETLEGYSSLRTEVYQRLFGPLLLILFSFIAGFFIVYAPSTMPHLNILYACISVLLIEICFFMNLYIFKHGALQSFILLAFIAFLIVLPFLLPRRNQFFKINQLGTP